MYLETPKVPEELTPTSFDQVSRCMISDRPNWSTSSISALISFNVSADAFDMPHDRLQAKLGHRPYPTDMSFSGQMAKIFERNQRFGSRLLKMPDVFVFTANSAIPVADSVRGYYDERGALRPILAAIETRPNATPRALENPGTETDHSNTFGVIIPNNIPLEGAAVCLVDQYVSTATTLKKATSYLLGVVGVKQLDVMRGQWYLDGNAQNPNASNMTSDFANNMYVLGARAARATK